MPAFCSLAAEATARCCSFLMFLRGNGGGGAVAAASSDMSLFTRTILACALTSSLTSAHGAFAGISVAAGSLRISLDSH